MEASLFKPNFGMAPNISKKRKSVNHLVRISVYNRITVDPDADAGIFILPPPKFTGTNGALFCNIPLSERKISLENIVQLHPHKLKEEGKDASNTKAQTTLVNRKSSGGHIVTFSEYMGSSLKILSKDCEEILYGMKKKCTEAQIHRLRVSLRRLRSVLEAYSVFHVIPSNINSKKVSQTLELLGPLRDADVMQGMLQKVEDKADNIGFEEKASLSEAKECLMKKRKKAAKKVLDILQEKKTRETVKNLKKVAKNPKLKPKFQHLAKSSVSTVIISLLMPQTASLLVHPAWHIDEIFKPQKNWSKFGLSTVGRVESTFPSMSTLDLPVVEKVHDLRKALRDLRYNMELYSQMYYNTERFRESLKRVKKLQGILGDLQDLQVLSNYLSEKCQPGSTPVLDRALAKEGSEIWEKWLKARNEIFEVKGQMEIFRALGSPELEEI